MISDATLVTPLAAGGIPSGASGASAQGAGKFQRALSEAVAKLNAGTPQQAQPSGTATLLNPLLRLNTDSTQLAAQADHLAQTDMRPSEMMMLTMRSHEFLFHCELVANVANRSSDGMQQLFRQQS